MVGDARLPRLPNLIDAHGEGENGRGESELRAVLGVNLDATLEQIEQAYRRYVARIHPDKFSGDTVQQDLAEQQLKQVNAGMALLRNAYKETHQHGVLTVTPLGRRLRTARTERLQESRS